MFFNGFTLHENLRETLHQTGGIRLRTGGTGPALLLLHGQPQSHAMWHGVAGLLADRFSLVCPDLPAGRSERQLASDMLALMQRLGHRSFGVAGHDVGGHVACRMALDAPDRVQRLAALEIVPIPEQLDRNDMAYALAGYQSCWFGQLHPKPEALVTRAPDAWFRSPATREDAPYFHPEAVADYLRLGGGVGEAAPHALPPDHRAGPPPEAVGRRTRIDCPTLVIWGTGGRIGGWYDPLALWRECVDGEVSGGPLPAGHFLAEEAPDAVAAAFRSFFGVMPRAQILS
ncbi:alpha/beta fold hydrolase [Lichenicoccus sp.]|uniref:alpha/beta fold hydrolase n=1 Tax=Lichenicoccus sp. TaxID=2781899 RepID=UPI003D120E66